MLCIVHKIRLIVIFFAFIVPSLIAATERSKSCVLSADFGTESCRVGLFNIESGELIYTSAVGYETKFPENGFAEQNPLHWWKSFATACQNVQEILKTSDLVGICIDTTACSVVSLDSNFEPLRPCLLWMDTRSATEAKEVMKLAKGDSSLQVNCGGEGPLSAEWMIPKAMWLKRDCDQWQRTKYVCEKQDYLNHLLTGEYCASGCNVAARWHWDGEQACDLNKPLSLTDQRKQGRPVTLLKSLDMEELLDRWPVRCVPMGGLVGYLTQKAATALQLPSGVPVFQGGPDAYVGMIGLGLAGNRPDGLALVTGSSHLHLTLAESSVEGGKGYWGPYRGAPLLGQAFAEGGQCSTGSVLAWLRRLLNGQSSNNSELSYKQLDEEAATVPVGSDGLMSLATFQGSRTPRTDPQLRGAFVGLSLAHSRGHLWRACLEGVCFGTRGAIDALPQEQNDRKHHHRKPIILAGGVSRSPLWLQMTADVTNRSVIAAEMDNSPLIGGAILAAAGHKLKQQQTNRGEETSNKNRAGDISASVREMSIRFIKEKQPITPNQTAVGLYDLAYKRYLRMTSSISPVCRVASTDINQPRLTSATNQSIQIVPSLLAADSGHLFQEASRCLSLGVKAFHLDICDGGPDCGGALTLGTAAVKAVQKAISAFGCGKNEVVVEVHLVADYSLSLLTQLAAAGTTRLVLQVERLQQTADNDGKTLTETALTIMKVVSSLGMQVGLCLSPQTDTSVLDPLLSLEWNIDNDDVKKSVLHVNVLCVNPGFGGQRFNHSCLSKVQYLHKNYRMLGKVDSIGVDGGISRDTSQAAIEAGAAFLVAGTSLFSANREYPEHVTDDPLVASFSELLQLSTTVSTDQFEQDLNHK